MSAPQHRSAARAFLIWRKQQQRKNDPRFSWHGEKPPRRYDSSESYFQMRISPAFRINKDNWK